MKKNTAALSSVAAGCAFAVALSGLTVRRAYSQAAPATKDDQGTSLLPDGAGKQLVVAKCVACHSAKLIMSKRGTEQDWNETLDKMITNGANVSDEEADKIVAYLTAHFGPSAASSGATAPSGSTQTGPAPEPAPTGP